MCVFVRVRVMAWMMWDRVKSAKPGENVTVKVVCSDSDVLRGFVLCSTVHPCHAATQFIAQIALVELTEQVSLQCERKVNHHHRQVCSVRPFFPEKRGR